MTDRTLTPEQHRILREHGTERPGSSPLNHEKRPGEFECAGCGAQLFDAKTKFESGTGWPIRVFTVFKGLYVFIGV